MPVAILLVRFAMCGISEDMAIQKYARTVTEPKSRLICTQNVMRMAFQASEGTNDPVESSRCSSVLKEA